MTLPAAAPRGPSGRAAMPPPTLAATTLPIDLVPAGTPMFRIHRIGHDPIHFGPGKGAAPTYRFDSAAGHFGVLYVGLSLDGAVVETVLRNPARRLVPYADLAARGTCLLTPARDLKLVRLHGTGLQALGCDNAISTGPYDPCGAWADALWAHKDQPDGIAYRSRHDPGQLCLALFERPDLRLAADDPVPLVRQLPMIAAILSRYGKSIDRVPV